MNHVPYRILSLSGGGVRGIFQAVFLSKLATRLGGPLSRHFDLIAGTSTGAISSLSVGLDIDLEKLVAFYRSRSTSVFSRGKLFAPFRTGARYKTEPLRAGLHDLFGEHTLSDCRSAILITASGLDRFKHRVFNTVNPASADGSLRAVDAALASGAAPTFFAPIKPLGKEMSYLDGGLWANSPLIPAIMYARAYKDIALERMRVLSVGTGRAVHGIPIRRFNGLRPVSAEMSLALFDLMFASQEDFADAFADTALGVANVIRVNTELEDPIPLDDAKSAIERLPALAEAEEENTWESIKARFVVPKNAGDSKRRPPAKMFEAVSADAVQAAGLTAFYASRDQYRTQREHASSIDRYVATAQRTLMMISVNLRTGLPIDGVAAVLKRKLEADDVAFRATVSLLDPLSDELMKTMAVVLDKTPADLSHEISESLRQLLHIREGMPASVQARFSIRVHRAIPFGSAILIDHETASGRIQVETKPYKAPMRQSFAFEVASSGENDLYSSLITGYNLLLADGEEVTEAYLNSLQRDPSPK